MFAAKLFGKWLLFLLFKSVIELPFVIVGPVALIGLSMGWDFWDMKEAVEAHTNGVLICCLITPFCLYDWTMSFLLPWRGGGRAFPVWWEDRPSLLEEIREENTWVY